MIYSLKKMKDNKTWKQIFYWNQESINSESLLLQLLLIQILKWTALLGSC